MTTASIRTSKPNSWVLPRPYTDPSQRFHTYGPVLPMEEGPPSIWRRLLGS